jgi:ribose transport system substrate-binding protein
MTDVLSKIPKAKTCVLTSINEETMSGIISAIQTAGRWDPENWIIITQGADAVGQQQIRDGLTDAAIAYFPEHYGEYLIPGAVALMHNQPVPPFMYVENAVITKDNIDQYYPKK